MDRILLIWYYIEVKYTQLLRLFNIRKKDNIIPVGMYCYEYDEERNAKNPSGGSYWIKTCKYYRSTKKTKGVACTYIGYYGFDPGLYDQCKLCSKNL